MTITNISDVSIEIIDISVQSTLSSAIESKIFRWDDENLQSQLPLKPQESTTVTLYMYAHMDFVAPHTQTGKRQF